MKKTIHLILVSLLFFSGTIGGKNCYYLTSIDRQFTESNQVGVISASPDHFSSLPVTSPLSIFDKLQREQVEEVLIRLPIDSLLAHKNTDRSFKGTFVYRDQNGQQLEKTISIKPRGKSRRRHCTFPPLRLKFSKNDLEHRGLREKHRSLKLVTHCNLTDAANDNVLKEYLVYKMYNTITPNSLNVRLLKIKYLDTDSPNQLEYYGFLLEDIDALAERLGGVESNTYGKTISEFEPNNVSNFTVFQFMIGNEDWEINARRNLRYIHLEKENQFLLIPYDFDMTGLVAVEYARPNVSLGMQSTTQRFFMGHFTDKKRRKKTLKYFRSKRKEIQRLIKECNDLSSSQKIYMKEYLASFYEIISDPILKSRAIPFGERVPEKSELDGRMRIL